MKNIAIITGGSSSEREISLISAQSVKTGLEKLGTYTIMRYDLPEDQASLFVDAHQGLIDFAFVMIHGEGGEDGQISGLLDLYDIPTQCTSRDVLALTINKRWTKTIRRQFNLPVAKDLLFQIGDYSVDELDEEIEEQLEYPCVRKELDQGSSKGVHIIHDKDDLSRVRSTYESMKQLILIEEFIEGDEITVPLLDIGHAPTVLPLVHIIPPEEGGFDYENKYNGTTQEICPAEFDADIIDIANDVALKAYLAVGCTKYGRVDAILTPDGPVLLEINTIPGFTSESLFPKGAKAHGIEFPQLLEVLMGK